MSTEITINQDIVEINVTEEVITIEAPSGAYPLPNLVSSVFGRVGNVVAQEGDYTLTQIGDVTLTSPSNGQVLKYNGTAWVNSSDTDTGLTSVGLSMPSAFSVANSPLTANGTLSVTGAGTTAQYVRGDGSLATLPSLTGFVPYTGATANLDLGTFDLTTDIVNLNQLKAIGSGGINIYSNSGTHIALMGGGGGAGTTLYGGLIGTSASFTTSGGSDTFAINHSSGSGIALNITKGGNGEGLYINKTSGSGNAATIIGTLNATTLVKSGGTSSQYLMADGSVSTLTNPVTGTGTTNTLPKFTGASTIGNSNVSDNGTLITLGSNTTISSGGLGIGSTSLTDTTLNIAKNITGATTYVVVRQSGVVQSDANANILAFNNQLNTQATSFALTQYIHYNATQGTIGAGSSVATNTGFNVSPSMIGATNNYGFRGSIPVGANRWNLFMDGTANNYMAGSLGIGTTILTGFSLNVGKTITGAITSYGISQIGSVQSDVTNTAIGVFNQLTTQSATFTLNEYRHFNAQQSTIGAGSSITTQTGFLVSANMIGATNNYGFRGSIPSGTNRFNLYMDGTAANYLAGDTGIGTASLGTATKLTIGGTETAVSGISRGQLINTTLVASANGDALVGLDIAPTFTAGAFTGVTPYNLRISSPSINGYSIFLNGNASINGSNQMNLLRNGAYVFSSTSIQTTVSSSAASTPLQFSLNSNALAVGQFFGTTGNFTLQNGGTFTDIPSARLAVNSTTQGFLPPRGTNAQRNAIASPAVGLIFYCTDATEGLYIYTSSGWKSLTMV
jgi:hypothetical protein